MRLCLDTNVLVYAESVERAPEDAAKRGLALRLLATTRSDTLVLARQALAELHSVLVRRLRLSAAEASARTTEWLARGEVVDTNQTVFSAALELAADHRLAIFDALILAAAVEARSDLLLSEDLQDGFSWRGVVVSNPFGPTPDRRIAELLS